MKKSTILKMTAALAIIFIGYANSWGQEVSMPVGLHKHGNNSSDVVKTSENKDSVTISAALQYWVSPDVAFSPNGVFTWSLANNPATLASLGASTTNLVTVNFNNTGVDTLKVYESSAAGCSGSIVKIPFEVIAKPTATYGTSPTAVCNLDPVNVSVILPVTLTTSVLDDSIRITYTISGANTKAATPVYLKKSAANFTLPAGTFSAYGSNTITITAVSDRISRKSSVAGTISGTVYTFVINRTPTTGPIYHLPNM